GRRTSRDVERGTGDGSEATGARREVVALPIFVLPREAGAALFPYTTLFRSAERAAAGIAPQRDGDRAGEPGRHVPEGIERLHFHRGAALVVRPRGARLRAEHQLGRRSRGDTEGAARRRVQAGRRRGERVARACL